MAKKKSTWLLCFSKLGSWLGFRRASIPPNLVSWVYFAQSEFHGSVTAYTKICIILSIQFQVSAHLLHLKVDMTRFPSIYNTHLGSL